MTSERSAAVAGMFYPGDSERLERWITKNRSPHDIPRRQVKGLILPHAGYIYSGGCALRALEQIIIPGRVVIIGLNHRYHHERLVIDGNDSWATPWGTVPIDGEWSDRLLGDPALFIRDNRLGREEHSLEVMVPLLRYFRADLMILPILVGSGDPDLLRAAAVRLAELTREEPDTLLLASTDMSHFISAAEAERQDGLAIERICALDMAGLIETVARHEISMCGVYSTALLLETVRLLGGVSGEVVCYTHSGKVTGDDSSVVAYLSAIIN